MFVLAHIEAKQQTESGILTLLDTAQCLRHFAKADTQQDASGEGYFAEANAHREASSYCSSRP